MAESPLSTEDKTDSSNQGLDGGSYELIRERLLKAAKDLLQRLNLLNKERKEVFGSIATGLLSSERVTTVNNCVPRDMVSVGEDFIFGYNVHIGLKSETTVEDVLSVYSFDGDHFKPITASLIQDDNFKRDFKGLYKYYKQTHFVKFAFRSPYLYMKFRVGKSIDDFKVFKWLMHGDHRLEYVDNRSDHELRYPPQHEFDWIRSSRDLQREGEFPHIAIADRLFVGLQKGQLVLKIEDNTDTGEGIYAEAVQEREQQLDDLELQYALLGHIIILRIRPYREQDFRYVLFNEKTGSALRIDALDEATILLPEGHGFIFPKGYYLATGEYFAFETNLNEMVFERRIPAPNGEDILFIFYNRDAGVYVLLSYNLIEQRVQTPIICNGFSLFEDGKLLYFKAELEPQKHHVLQIWQTPYVGPNFKMTVHEDSYLYQLGNKDVVRCMAECHELYSLLQKEDNYANLYLDIVKRSGDILDTFFWINDDRAHNLGLALASIRSAASSAVDEFEKVQAVKKDTSRQVAAAAGRTEELLKAIRLASLNELREFVEYLAALRTLRGTLIALQELRYVDTDLVVGLDERVKSKTDELSAQCIDFLMREDALQSYKERVDGIESAVADLEKVRAALECEAAIDAVAGDLELLIEIVSNLKIGDSSKTTLIIDNISANFAKLNQVRAQLRGRKQQLAEAEGRAEFAAQIKLVSQGLINYLDLCDTPARCDEFLTKLMVQLEELEARFTEFDEFAAILVEKREEVYNAFESKKLALVEARNRRSLALLASAERILTGVSKRSDTMTSAEEISSYFAADLMIEKVRDIIDSLNEIGDSVKADDVQTRLKTAKEEALRQLKDRSELFVDGSNVIRLGKHNFSVNTEVLDVTIVRRDDSMFYHLTGTKYFREVEDASFMATRPVWQQQLPSENDDVYRGEFLAYTILRQVTAGDGREAEALRDAPADKLADYVRQFCAGRYDEGYIKGVHDSDAALLLKALLDLHHRIGLLRYSSTARACAIVYWQNFIDGEQRDLLAGRLNGIGEMLKLFPSARTHRTYVKDLQQLLHEFAVSSSLFAESTTEEAGEYLFYELTRGNGFAIAPEAAALLQAFTDHLYANNFIAAFNGALDRIGGDAIGRYQVVRSWLRAFLTTGNDEFRERYLDEAASMIFNKHELANENLIDISVRRTISGMNGVHQHITKSVYRLDYNEFIQRLSYYCREVVPLFRTFSQGKKELADKTREEMRLSEFMPRVLTSFVRNRLIDRVYLPLIGDNLAKQMGQAGVETRTDRMGLLLLISPPGYGKTTLMEYVANRLGLFFMKINGPAIGHRVTSLDPGEAPNAAAREEMEKLNLAFEMGDNVMIYVDDIQHCHPEFLQKFISLCDAQRKIEGVYRGKSTTHDLRGRKVAVVMAGNPYTESGEKFTIPDMLANRADTYNLGDIGSGEGEAFKLSYLENCMTSNVSLSRLAARHREDLYAFIQWADSDRREGIEFYGDHSAADMNEYVNVVRKLIWVRDVILRVNQQYIESAATADAYRTEPPFLLQGSYRDMNKIAEKVLPMMNDEELKNLVLSHYVNESQTLAGNAEANLLKFRAINGMLSPEEEERWEHIKTTFRDNQLFGGGDSGDTLDEAVRQMRALNKGVAGIERALKNGKD